MTHTDPDEPKNNIDLLIFDISLGKGGKYLCKSALFPGDFMFAAISLWQV